MEDGVRLLNMFNEIPAQRVRVARVITKVCASHTSLNTFAQ